MFNVLFTTTTTGGHVSSVNVAFENETQADNAIILFLDSSARHLYRDAVRLYRERFEFKLNWSVPGKLSETEIMYGYRECDVVDKLYQEKGRHIILNSVVQKTKTLS